MPIKIPVKTFWTTPNDPPLTSKSISFGYEDQKGKKWRYKVEVLGQDRESFVTFVHSILDSKKKNSLPWPEVSKLKDKVKITNLDVDSVQLELPLKVARRYNKLRN